MPARWRVGKRVLENAPAFGATISLVVIWNCCFANAFTIDFDLNGGGNNVSRAVEFLASWELEEDREVLQSLLTFRGYERLPTASGPSAQAPVTVNYPVRAALRKSGVPVPGDIILEGQLTAAETVR